MVATTEVSRKSELNSGKVDAEISHELKKHARLSSKNSGKS